MTAWAESGIHRRPADLTDETEDHQAKDKKPEIRCAGPTGFHLQAFNLYASTPAP